MSNTSLPKQSQGQIGGRVIAGILVVAAVIVAAVIFLRPKPVPVPVPDAASPTPLVTVAPAQTSEERGDSARDVIARLRADTNNVDYTQAYRRAGEFRNNGEFADAQLLYFFAARGGHAGAAFDLATLYDPNHFAADNGLMAEPDSFQAYKWYQSARDAGNTSAAARLDELRAWAENAASAGDTNAERLLLQWE